MDTQTTEKQTPEAPTVNVQYVTDEQFDAAVSAAQDRARLGRLRAYLRPILTQQAKNVAQAAANGISDFEAMKRGREMLERLETESD